MDWMFWVGLGLGALISLPISIIANLWTEKVRDFLGKRRTIRLSNKKSKELRTYFFVRALAEGNPTAKVLFDIDATFSNRAAILMMLMFMAVGAFFILLFQPKLQPYKTFIVVSALVFSVMGLVMHAWSMYLHFYLLQVRFKLRRFHDYENRIREKWGDDALEEFLQPPQGSN